MALSKSEMGALAGIAAAAVGAAMLNKNGRGRVRRGFGKVRAGGRYARRRFGGYLRARRIRRYRGR